MASSFTQRLNELFTMFQTAPDANGNRRPFKVSEVHAEIILLTGGESKISERRLRQLKQPGPVDENPTIGLVNLVARAIESLSRKANPNAPHPPVEDLVAFLISGKRSSELDPAADADSGEPEAQRTDVVTVMGRFWDYDEEARKRIVAFLDQEDKRMAKRRWPFRGGRGADGAGDTGSSSER